MDDERLEHGPDVLAHDKIGDIIELGRLTIDDGEPRAIAFRHQGKTCRRPDHERRADGQEQIATQRQFLGAPHGAIGHCLAKGYGRGFDVAAAGWTIWRTAIRRFHPLAHPGQFVAIAAVEAETVGRIAVQLDHMFRRDSRGLMKIIDILRDDCGDFAGVVQTGERAMPPPRPGVAELVSHGEAASPGLIARFLARQKLIEWNRLILGPQSSGSCPHAI